MIKLFVGGFPPHTDEMELAQLFGPYGEISTITIVRDRNTKKCKGYAFIEMKAQKGSDHVIAELNGQIIGKRRLIIRPAIEKPKPSKPRT
jgi:RNA recognition motif-containing protein